MEYKLREEGEELMEGERKRGSGDHDGDRDGDGGGAEGSASPALGTLRAPLSFPEKRKKNLIQLPTPED